MRRIRKTFIAAFSLLAVTLLTFQQDSHSVEYSEKSPVGKECSKDMLGPDYFGCAVNKIDEKGVIETYYCSYAECTAQECNTCNCNC